MPEVHLEAAEINALREMRILIATPMFGGQCYGGYNTSIAGLLNYAGALQLNLHFFPLLGESFIPRGRNTCADKLLRGNFTHLFFIDADIEFNPMDVLKLLLLDVGLVGGAYPKKKIRWDKIVNNENPMRAAGEFVVLPEKPGDVMIKPNELFPVRYLGTGFLCIKRAVFEQIISLVPDKWHKKDDNPDEMMYEFFAGGAREDDKTYMTEDYYFCKQVTDIGIKIYLAPWVQLKHQGTFVFDSCLFCSYGQSSECPHHKNDGKDTQ